MVWLPRRFRSAQFLLASISIAFAGGLAVQMSVAREAGNGGPAPIGSQSPALPDFAKTVQVQVDGCHQLAPAQSWQNQGVPAIVIRLVLAHRCPPRARQTFEPQGRPQTQSKCSRVRIERSENDVVTKPSTLSSPTCPKSV